MFKRRLVGETEDRNSSRKTEERKDKTDQRSEKFQKKNIGERTMGRQKNEQNIMRIRKAHLNTSLIHYGALGMTLRTKKRINPSKDPQGSPGGVNFTT